ncbi:MAG TPA: TlpA disulfide reductase family protein [Planctomycetota bacterium]
MIRAASLARRALLVLLACASCDAAGAPRAVPPEVVVADLAGLEQALAARRGQPLLLNFWATWCAPCVAELPDLLAAVRAHEADGLRVLGVSYDLMLPNKEPEAVRAAVLEFLQGRDLALPTVVFDGPDYDAIDARFELPGPIPVTLAIDRSGQIVERAEGEGTRARFDELARRALGR